MKKKNNLYVFIALIPIILFSIYKNSFVLFFYKNGTVYESLHPILIYLVAILTAYICELLFAKFVFKNKVEDFILTPIFFALIIPINTPLFIVFIGTIFAVVVGKLIFGGYGNNIFNPALLGALFITFSYHSLIGGYLTKLDTVASVTPLTNLMNMNYIGSFSSIVGNFFKFLVGTIPGTLGEVNKILILIGFIFLVYKKAIKHKITISYVLTVFIMTYIIGFKMGIFYPLFHILSGGLLFGAVFMATDPVTSPKKNEVLYGICLGILTVVLRFLTPYPEGVMVSILFMNMLVSLFEKNLKYFYLIIVIVIGLGLSIFINHKISNVKEDESVKIIRVEKSNDVYLYTVTTKGFGVIEAEVKIKDSKIIDVEFLNNNGETYWFEIEKNNYIDKFINNNNIEDIDTINGATITSKGLKNMFIKLIEDYEVNYEN